MARVCHLTPHFWNFVYTLTLDPCSSRAIERVRNTVGYRIISEALEHDVDWFLLDKRDVSVVMDRDDEQPEFPGFYAFHDITYLFLRLIACYSIGNPVRPHLEMAYQRMLNVCNISDITDAIERLGCGSGSGIGSMQEV